MDHNTQFVHKDSHTGVTNLFTRTLLQESLRRERMKRAYSREEIDSAVYTLDEQYVLIPLKKRSRTNMEGLDLFKFLIEA